MAYLCLRSKNVVKSLYKDLCHGDWAKYAEGWAIFSINGSHSILTVVLGM